MPREITTNVEWLDSGKEIPLEFNWIRSNERPKPETRRYFLSVEELGKPLSSDDWVLFQPGLSAVNKSYVDFPDELRDTCVVRVKLLRVFDANAEKPERTPSFSDEPNIWYECKVLEVIGIMELAQLNCNFAFSMPEYLFPEEVQYFEYEDFICLCWPGQGYAGKTSLFVRIGEDIVLLLHEEWYGENNEAFFTSYKLALNEKEVVIGFSKSQSL